MKKILMSLLTIAIVGALITGGTMAFFSDVETGEAVFATGTIDIAIDEQNPWEGEVSIADAKPCQVWYQEYEIENVGTNPCVIWKHLDITAYGPGTAHYPEVDSTCSSEPEYQVDSSDTHNAIGKWILYDLYSVVIDPLAGEGTDQWHHTEFWENAHVHDLDCVWIPLGSLPAGGKMWVEQSYHLDADTPNKHQGDTMDFNIIFHAQQIEGTTVLMENKLEPQYEGGPAFVMFDDDGDGVFRDDPDDIWGKLDYNSMGATFDYTFEAQGLKKDGTYYLIYYADPWKGDHPGAVIATLTATGGNIASISGSTELNMDLPGPTDANYLLGAKIWLVPSSDYNPDTKQMTAWNEEDYLYETHLIWYNDTDVPNGG